MAADPVFSATATIDSVNVAAANTGRDGTGTITTLSTGVAAGSMITSITAQAAVTTTAGAWRLWLSVDSGTTWRLVDEYVVPAITATAGTNAPARKVWSFSDLRLMGTTHRLGVTTNNAESVNFIARGYTFA